MELVYKKPEIISDTQPNNFCPGCMHSSTWKIISEVVEEMGLADKAVWVAGVGCVANAHRYIQLDRFGIGHGRGCAGASAFKRCNPETFVFTYQGDGDLAAIGLAETMSAANRGDNFTVIFVNNGTYGMTGGQMAPTTLIGQKTTTSPYGRKPEEHGYPMHMCEILNVLEAPSYIARVTTADVPNAKKAKQAVRDAFQHQLDGKGFSFVEFISNCPTNWGMTPLESLDHIHNTVLKEFPLGVFRNR
ncbi:MAG: 2-oxoglutarate oxidoreductase [Lachnospiraceae bacterium]|nr:2-oxoglutarate oxidoreductase [Lachnospiraceae bacterium]